MNKIVYRKCPQCKERTPHKVKENTPFSKIVCERCNYEYSRIKRTYDTIG